MLRGDAKAEGLGEIAGQVGLKVDQQPLDAAVGPVGQGALLGRQQQTVVFDGKLGGVGQFALAKGYADGDRFGDAIKLGKFFEMEGAHVLDLLVCAFRL